MSDCLHDQSLATQFIFFVQELQELNQKQTAIIRDLSAQQEHAAAEMRADLEAEKDRLNKKVDLDIAYSRKQRKEQEVFHFPTIFSRKSGTTNMNLRALNNRVARCDCDNAQDWLDFASRRLVTAGLSGASTTS